MRERINKETFVAFLYLTAGAILAAFALEEFLVPNNVFDGGVVGVSMILAYYTPLKLGTMMVLLNVPFLLLGLRKLGKLFLIKVAYAMVLFAVMTESRSRTESIRSSGALSHS